MNERRRKNRETRQARSVDRRLTRFDGVGVGQEFYHGATLFVKKSMSSATTAVTRRLQRFTPSTQVRSITSHSAKDLSARQMAADAYHRFVEACDQLHV